MLRFRPVRQWPFPQSLQSMEVGQVTRPHIYRGGIRVAFWFVLNGW